jgi:antitoxin VapB
MNLQIRDPRARDMARKLAVMNDCTMTEAVVDTLDFRLRKINEEIPLIERVKKIQADLRAMAGPNGRDMTKEEIDDMWGQ